MAWFNPRTWTDGETVTAAMMNGIRDSLKAIGDPATAYTPTWNAATTAPVLGNGTLTGSYRQAGKWVDVRLVLIIGSTTTLGSGFYSFSLPVAATAAWPQHAPVGDATMLDASAPTVYVRNLTLATATTVALRDNPGTPVSNSAPVVWATGDRIMLSAEYEAA